MQKVSHHFILAASKIINSGSFHSSQFFSTFPHGTSFSIAHSIIFSLRGYTPNFILFIITYFLIFIFLGL
jgi:hypothetical protein